MTSPLCNRCRTSMSPGEGVVPVWVCGECSREVPMEPGVGVDTSASTAQPAQRSTEVAQLREALLKLAGLVLADHEADERGFLHYDTEYEGVIRDRASLAQRLLDQLGIDRPPSPYKPTEDAAGDANALRAMWESRQEYIELAERRFVENNELIARAGELERALRPFSALADAVDSFDGMTDAEWARLKDRVRRDATTARDALHERWG